MLALLLTAIASAGTLTVGPTGDYALIQDAINASVDGDRIEVSGGTYNENLVVLLKDITLVGVDGPEATTIAGSGVFSSTIFVNFSADFTIEGFEITSDSNENLTISNSIGELNDLRVIGSGMTFTANTYLEGSIIDISDSTFDGQNTSTAILSTDTILTLTDTVIENGLGAYYSSGALTILSGTAAIEGCRFANNRSEAISIFSGYAAAISASSTVLSIRDTTFDSNVALGSYGGGGSIGLNASTVSIEDSTFANGNVEGSGGAITANSSTTLTLTNVSFTDISAGEEGGALWLKDSTLIADNVTISSSEAGVDGGAIYAEASDMSLTASVLEANSADDRGGAIYSDGPVTITDSTLSDNEAREGGALFVLDADVTITNSAFAGNESQSSGGAIRWDANNNSPDLTIEGTLFDSNIAGVNGGAAGLKFGNEAIFRDNTFEYNSAKDGGAVSFFDIRRVTAQRNRFCANEATNNAGAVRLNDAGTSTNIWRNNILIENQAAANGGAIYARNAGILEVTNNTLLGNAALDGGALWTTGTQVDVLNSLIATTVSGDAIDIDASSADSLDYSDLFDNTPQDFTRSPVNLGANNLALEPLLTSVNLDGICGNDQLWPTSASPLIDAGDPSILDDDGSVSDIGAYGGPDGLVYDPNLDNDQDGYPAATDCNDNAPDINPDADETCNGVDDDCDGFVDESGATGQIPFYFDFDGDGYGDADISVTACSAPNGYADNNTDCDDTNGSVYPGADEVCDNRDNDCNGLIDDNVAAPTVWYPDVDADGFGDDNGAVEQCEQPAGHVTIGGDCDEQNALVNPAAKEVCNGVDDDCNAITDDDPVDGDIYFLDADDDGFGDLDAQIRACGLGDGYVSDSTDCDDTSATTYPGAPEECTSDTDTNCDGLAGDPDADSDGFVACLDCDDSDPAINPEAQETWYDGIDQDCDGASDFDQDGDGFNAADYNGTDCNDTDPGINPDAEDLKGDDIDANCDNVDGINPKLNDPFVDEALQAAGCGCSNTTLSQSGLSVLLAALLVVLQRRRREPASA